MTLRPGLSVGKKAESKGRSSKEETEGPAMQPETELSGRKAKDQGTPVMEGKGSLF